ncbi:uncharacterized protein BJ212DRAFT_1364563 [Suillus subaureus]|uniref:Uncharacterized protein n=1 Tax=Suillus subaureus TaxID=48587 RepID=A0A9P7JBU3_9AGAM|nr:uncharacterized protein BJ212DRAFT_1364563 [Suillus subaureus]KAG1813920.1 hypothetical protein BJ212DRAFT_1364563 [Suillus subaureus]
MDLRFIELHTHPTHVATHRLLFHFFWRQQQQMNLPVMPINNQHILPQACCKISPRNSRIGRRFL